MIFQENIQIGMVRTFFFNSPALPKTVDLPRLAPEFAFNYQANLDPEKELLVVPKDWMGFFKALLEAPAQHAWSKKLLESGFPSFLHMGPQGGCHLDLGFKPSPLGTCSLLESEPSTAKELEEAIPLEDSEEFLLPKKRGRKGKAVTPIVDSMVRRSSRVRANTNGFKHSTCKIRNCLGCSNDPPILSPTSLKKIGTSMCQLQEDQLEEQMLLVKDKLEPMGKKGKKNMEGDGKPVEDKERGTDGKNFDDEE